MPATSPTVVQPSHEERKKKKGIINQEIHVMGVYVNDIYLAAAPDPW